MLHVTIGIKSFCLDAEINLTNMHKVCERLKAKRWYIEPIYDHQDNANIIAMKICFETNSTEILEEFILDSIKL